MNKDLAKKWIERLRIWNKESSWKHLRFPLKIESVSGNLFSPEGILCQIHSEVTGTEWTPKDRKEKKLKSYQFYLNSVHVAPQEVLDWIGIRAPDMSYIRSLNDADGSGFSAVANYLETLG